MRLETVNRMSARLVYLKDRKRRLSKEIHHAASPEAIAELERELTTVLGNIDSLRAARGAYLANRPRT